MNRVARALWVVGCFLVGVLLVCLPWRQGWEHNYFLNRFPGLVRVLLHPSLRGVVSGLGLLDIVLAAGMIRWRQKPPRDSHN
jgi:hypothetical protein